jgi:L-amino acid N-acyltransferase YncA
MQRMTVAIRPAKTSDIPAITRIYAHAVKHGTASFELESPDEAEMTRRMQAILDDKFPYFVAEIGGSVAGYAYASLYRTRPAYRFTVEDSVYVAPDIHRRGVGKALLIKLIEACTALGYRQMLAVIGDSNQAASIGVHRACGFTDAGNLRNIGRKFGRWLDTPLMQLTLGPGATTAPQEVDDDVPDGRPSSANLH